MAFYRISLPPLNFYNYWLLHNIQFIYHIAFLKSEKILNLETHLDLRISDKIVNL